MSDELGGLDHDISWGSRNQLAYFEPFDTAGSAAIAFRLIQDFSLGKISDTERRAQARTILMNQVLSAYVKTLTFCSPKADSTLAVYKVATSLLNTEDVLLNFSQGLTHLANYSRL